MKKILLLAIASSVILPCQLLAQAPAPSPSAPAAPALDFGDFSSSTITTKAWGAFEQKDYPTALGYTDKCIEMFGTKAVEMQKALTAPLTEKEQIHAQWALNDVGTCNYIKGMTLEAQGKKTEAVAAYKFLAENLGFAQCWDTKGWFWKPADAAREKLKKLEFDAE